MSSLCAAGITHIINLQDEFDDRAIADGAAVEIYWLRSNGGLTCEALREARRFADAALDGRGNRLFIHCMAGRTRSPKLAYAVLVWRGFAPREAVEMLRSAIPDAMVEEKDLEETVALMRDLGR
jgi:protein-tyrosine phosphatase